MIQEISGLESPDIGKIWNESIRRDEEPTHYVTSYYVHIQSPTMVLPQMKESFIDNPHIWS
jgi:hypothetical protein